MRVSLSSGSTPRIENASPEWLQHFGFDLPTCRGRTLNLVRGPDTNHKKLANLIETAQNDKVTQAQLVLYAKSGDSSLFHVRAHAASSRSTSCDRSSCLQRVELVLTCCESISTFEEAIQEDGNVKVLVHAKKPFKVAHVSAACSSTYGLSPEHLVNRTLGVIQGPLTNFDAWTAALDGALGGTPQAACVQTYHRDGSEVDLTQISVTPVIGSGDVGYLLIAMSKSKSADMPASAANFDGSAANLASPLNDAVVQDDFDQFVVCYKADTSLGTHATDSYRRKDFSTGSMDASKRPSALSKLSECTPNEGAQRRVTFSVDTCDHCYENRRLRTIAHPLARALAAWKQPSVTSRVSECTSTEGAQRSVTFSSDTCDHCYENRRLRPVAHPLARALAAPTQQSLGASIHTVRIASVKLQKHRAAQHRKEMLKSKRIPLRHALLATLTAVLVNFMMTISSIMTLTSSLICGCLWTSSPSTLLPVVAARSREEAPNSPCSAAREAYMRDWQHLHSLEMSASQLADFSPY